MNCLAILLTGLRSKLCLDGRREELGNDYAHRPDIDSVRIISGRGEKQFRCAVWTDNDGQYDASRVLSRRVSPSTDLIVHVFPPWRLEHIPLLVWYRRLDEACRAEVDDLEMPQPVNHQVFRVDIPVSDAQMMEKV